jgi:TIR domain-containing protein
VKLFISWSGELSHRVALNLREWLPVVLPFVDPWVSSEDIPKGSRWGAELAAQLEVTDAGIVCLVPGNIEEPWLNFEAGALSKSVEKARIHPFLLAIDPRELIGPLGQFQATRFTKDDVIRLVSAINSEATTGALSAERVDRSFEVCWPDLERRLTPLLPEAGVAAAEPESGRPSRKEPATRLLSDEDVKMLQVIANAADGVRRDMAGAALGVHPQHAQHVMERLENQDLLVAAHNYRYGTAWHLSKKGRAFLVSQGLL